MRTQPSGVESTNKLGTFKTYVQKQKKKNNVRRKKNGKQQKGWNFFPSQQEMEEDEAEVDLPFPRNNQTS